jgi:hypothetical protein
MFASTGVESAPARRRKCAEILRTVIPMVAVDVPEIVLGNRNAAGLTAEKPSAMLL